MQFRGNCASCFVFTMNLSYGVNKFSFGQTGAAGDAGVTALPLPHFRIHCNPVGPVHCHYFTSEK